MCLFAFHLVLNQFDPFSFQFSIKNYILHYSTNRNDNNDRHNENVPPPPPGEGEG